MVDLFDVVSVSLALVFLVSGAAKVLDLPGTRSAVGAFGVPERLVTPVHLAVPVLELLSAALVLGPSRRLGALLALVLLSTFTAAVVINLVLGRRPECRCFGRLGVNDVSWRTVVRNGVLVLAALAVATAGAGSLVLPHELLAVVLGTAGAAAVLLAEHRLQSRTNARSSAELAAFEGGTGPLDLGLAPDVDLKDLAGRAVTLSSTWTAGLPVILVFTSPTCLPCRRLEPVLAQWADLYADRLRIVLLTTGSRKDNEEVFSGRGLLVLDDSERWARAAYGSESTPTGVLVLPDGRIGSPRAVGEGLIRRLLVAALERVAVDLASMPAVDGKSPALLDLGDAPRPRPAVVARTGEQGLVLVDEGTGASLLLDQVGAAVWSELDGSTLLRVSERLVLRSGAPLSVVGPDVLSLCRELGRNGMLTGISAEWPEYETDLDEVQEPVRV